MALGKLKHLKAFADPDLYFKSASLIKMLVLGRNTKYPPEVFKLEKDFAGYIGTKYALSFCNGTSSFDAALFALNMPEDSEVIISTMAFHSTVMGVLHNRLNLKFVDVDDDINMVLDDALVTDKTKAIIVSHLFGYPQNISAVLDFAKKHNLYILEDCSHSHGATYKGKKTGSFGDISFFSFQGNKAIAGGESGMAVTSNETCFDRMRLYMHMGRDLSDLETDLTRTYPFFKNIGFGKKGRMHPFAAALAARDLKTLDRKNQRYRDNLADLYKIIDRYDFIRPVTISGDKVTGGYHYGIPLFVQRPQDIIQERFFKNGELSFLSFPYVSYERYEFFRSHKAFHNLIRQKGAPEAEHDPFQNSETLRNSIVFLNIEQIGNFPKYKEALIRFLDTIRHET